MALTETRKNSVSFYQLLLSLFIATSNLIMHAIWKHSICTLSSDPSPKWIAGFQNLQNSHHWYPYAYELAFTYSVKYKFLCSIFCLDHIPNYSSFCSHHSAIQSSPHAHCLFVAARLSDLVASLAFYIQVSLPECVRCWSDLGRRYATFISILVRLLRKNVLVLVWDL